MNEVSATIVNKLIAAESLEPDASISLDIPVKPRSGTELTKDEILHFYLQSEVRSLLESLGLDVPTAQELKVQLLKRGNVREHAYPVIQLGAIQAWDVYEVLGSDELEFALLNPERKPDPFTITFDDKLEIARNHDPDEPVDLAVQVHFTDDDPLGADKVFLLSVRTRLKALLEFLELAVPSDEDLRVQCLKRGNVRDGQGPVIELGTTVAWRLLAAMESDRPDLAWLKSQDDLEKIA